jgi:DNA end-binding protein Ku
VMETLRYADEVRRAQSYFKDIPEDKPDPELLDLATTLIDKKTAPFDAGEFEDRYVEALKALVEKKAKAKGKKILEDVEEPSDASGSNVIDLMAALKKSVDGDAKSSAKSASAEKPATKRASSKSTSKSTSKSSSAKSGPSSRTRKQA